MRKLFKSLTVVLLIIMASCNNDQIHIFISNSSQVDSALTLEVKFNNKQAIKEQINYTNITSEYYEYTFESKSDSIKLDLVSSTGVKKRGIMIPVNERFIFITYVYKIINDTGGAYKYDSLSRYIPGTDSVLVTPKDILIASYSRMP